MSIWIGMSACGVEEPVGLLPDVFPDVLLSLILIL